MIYDFIDGTFEEPSKKEAIYTGEGSPFEVRCGDSADLIKEIGSESIHTCIFDPPYGVNINKDWDSVIPPLVMWEECYRVLKPGGHLVFFGQPSMMPQIFELLSQTDFRFRDMIIWAFPGTHPKGYKTDDGAFRSKIRNVYNPIFIYRKQLEGSEEVNWQHYRTNLLNIDDTRMVYKGDHSGIIKKFEETGEAHYQSEVKSNTFSNMERKGWVPDARGAIPTNVIYCSRATKDERTVNGQVINKHETVKPVALMNFLVKLFTNSPEQVILDVYTGSGSTGMACRRNNRKFIGFELDHSHAELARFRIKHTFDVDDKHFDKLRQV